MGDAFHAGCLEAGIAANPDFVVKMSAGRAARIPHITDTVATRYLLPHFDADLRQMGIPIEMITLGGDAAGEGAYKVDRRKFELSDLRLTDSEREALQMAVATIRLGASHGDEALWKLGGERALNTPSTSVNVQLDDSILPALAAGVVEHRTFNFTYKGEVRRVDPYGLLARNGFCSIEVVLVVRKFCMIGPQRPNGSSTKASRIVLAVSSSPIMLSP